MMVIGEKGIAFFAPVNELFLLCTLLGSTGLAETTSSMMQYRMKREQFRNTHRVFRSALNITILFAFALGIAIIVFRRYISSTLFLEDFSRLALIMIAPATVFIAFTCLLRAYFQGVGSPYPTAHSLILEQLFTLAVGVLFAIYFFDYGKKVAAILRDDSFARAYGAMGAALGILLAALASFLHLLLIYFIYGGTYKRQIYHDNNRQLETPGFLYQSLLLQAAPLTAVMLAFNLNNLLDQRFFFYFANRFAADFGETFDKAVVWGNYYGVFLTIIGVIVAFASLTVAKAVKNITASLVREEYGVAREHLMMSIQISLFMTIPLSVLTAVLAEPLVTLLGQGTKEISVRLLQWGSSLIFFLSFNIFWLNLLRQFKRTVSLMLMVGGGLLVHIAAIWLLLSGAKEADALIVRVILSNLLSAGFTFGCGFLFVAGILKYRGEWLYRNVRTLAVSLLCSAIVGLMVLFLSTGIKDLLAPAYIILICLLVAVPAYLVLMTMLRGLTAAEFDRIPGGQYLVRLGRLMNFL
jgi:stage V sporulation protein B